MKKTLTLIFALISSAVCAQTTSSPNSETKLPSTATVDASLQRTFGYDPSLSWTIVNIRESAIPGIPEITISINKGAPLHLFTSPDGKTAVVGNTIPFGMDPYAPMRAALETGEGFSRGPKDAKITLAVFSDLQCPNCKAVQSILDKLYVDFPGMRQTFQQFPLAATLHPWAMKGAEYADCVGRLKSEAAWKYVTSVFDAQDKITVSTADKMLTTLAVSAGLKVEAIAACVAAADTKAKVEASLALGRSIVLDVDQAPKIFINGRTSTIATIPYDQIKRLVQFEVSHAGK